MQRVLIVDDEIFVRRALRRLLVRAGFQCIEAPDGQAALEQLREGPADLVITDIEMPEMDGLELTATLRFELPGVKIIAMSGAFDIAGDLLQAARALGADGALAKPFTPPEVLRLTRELLGCGPPHHSAVVGAAMRSEPTTPRGPTSRRAGQGGDDLPPAASTWLRARGSKPYFA